MPSLQLYPEQKKFQVLKVLISIMKTHELSLVTNSSEVNIVETLIQNRRTCDVGYEIKKLLILDVIADIRQHATRNAVYQVADESAYVVTKRLISVTVEKHHFQYALPKNQIKRIATCLKL